MRFMLMVFMVFFITAVAAQESTAVQLENVYVSYTLHDDKIRATFQADFRMDTPGRFSWIIPIPGQAVLVERELVPAIDREVMSEVSFAHPYRYCDDPFPPPFANVGGYYSAAQLDQVVLAAAEVPEWVASHGAAVIDPHALLASYPDHSFLAVYFEAPADDGRIKPFSVEYAASTLQIPLRSFFGTGRVWISVEGSGRYVPVDMPLHQVDFHDLRATQTVPARNNYNELRDNAASNAWITEEVRETGVSVYPYYTRLYGYFDKPVTTDPVLGSLTTFAEVASQINVADYVDPITYWGCATPLAAGQEIFLTDGIVIRYPEGWVARGDNRRYDVHIHPRDNDQVYVRVRPVSEVSEYQLEDLPVEESASARCPQFLEPVMFEQDGRKGWFYITEAGQYLVEFSAPAADFERFSSTLDTIRNNLEYRAPCG